MPPVIPTKPQRKAPAPENAYVYPWRFRIGDVIYALGHSTSFTVVGGELWMGCPHVHATAVDGRLWRLPQLHCSSRPPSAVENGTAMGAKRA